MFTSRFQRWVRRRAEGLVTGLARLGVTPNQVTVAGMLATFVAAGLAANGQLLAAGLLLAFSGTFDILDGALARVSRKMHSFGAFFDSTLDRYTEGAVYVGLAAYFLRLGSAGRWSVLAAVLALIGSFQVSYARARAQSLGFECESGLFQRPERVVAIVTGLILGSAFPQVLVAVIWILAVVTNFSALQRIHEVWRQARNGVEAAAPAPTASTPAPKTEPEGKQLPSQPARDPGPLR